MPIGLHALATLLAIVLLVLGSRRMGTGLAVSSSLLLLLLATKPVASAIAGSLELQYPPTPIIDLPEADAIALLGGGLAPGPSPERINLNDAGDRILHAARLVHAGRADLVICLGGVTHRDSDRKSSTAMAELLTDLGVPSERIVVELDSTTTRENLLRLQPIAESRGLRTILLVTSSIHMPRALAACQGVGLLCIPAATDFNADIEDHGLTGPGEWLPTVSSLKITSQAIWELIGLASYHLRGWAG